MTYLSKRQRWAEARDRWEYRLVDRHVRPWARAVARRWQDTTTMVQRWVAALTARAHRQEEHRMDEHPMVAVTPESLASLGRVLLARMDHESAEAIAQAISDEIRQEVQAQAVVEARAALEQEFTDRTERLMDRVEGQRRQYEHEAAALVDLEVAAAIADQQREWDERLDLLRARLRDARDRAQVAEGVCISLMTQLCGGVDQPQQVLYSGGRGVSELDLAAVNRVLGRVGLRLRSRATVSDRKVVLRLEDGQVVEHTRFWLTSAPVAGEVEEDEAPDPAAGAVTEGAADDPPHQLRVIMAGAMPAGAFARAIGAALEGPAMNISVIEPGSMPRCAKRCRPSGCRWSAGGC